MYVHILSASKLQPTELVSDPQLRGRGRGLSIGRRTGHSMSGRQPTPVTTFQDDQHKIAATKRFRNNSHGRSPGMSPDKWWLCELSSERSVRSALYYSCYRY